MSRLLRAICVFGSLYAIAACSGAGCTSCGVAPLATDVSVGQTVENAASLRVTQQGVAFTQTNIGTLASKALGSPYNVAIGKSSTDLTVATATICAMPSPSQCQANVDLANVALTMTPSGPHDLKITGTVPVKVDDIPVDIVTVINTSCTADVGVGSNLSCSGNTPVVSYVPVPIAVDLSLETDQNQTHGRFGYTGISIVSITPSIDSSMVDFCGGACASIANALKTYIVSALTTPLTAELKAQLESALCLQANTTSTPCPSGNDVNGTCRYGTADTDACVPSFVGLAGKLDTGALLASISPGASSLLDFVIAGGGPDANPNNATNTLGDLDPVANGISFGMVGGAVPDPQSACVPAFTNKIPTGIPTPDELRGNTLTPWPMSDPGPDLGVALAGRYLDYLFASIYNSGGLCLGVSTAQFAQLQSGLLSVLVPSIKRLTFEEKGAPVAITTRPQQPPTVKIGGGTDINADPLMLVTLPQFAIDFYVWSDDRYVRAFTFTGDVAIPIDLSTHVDASTNPNGGILPSLGTVTVANGTVTNSDLIVDPPASVASGLSSLLGGIAGQLVGGLKPIDLSTALGTYGIALTIPDGAIRKLTKGSDDFIGIFADFSLAKQMDRLATDVQAHITNKTVFPEAMSLTTADRSKLPRLDVELGSSLAGTYAIEWSYAIDRGTHSEWSQQAKITISNDALFLQGKHTLSVWARIHGQELSESTTPAIVPFVIDVLPPFVNLETTESGAIHVDTWDIVSDTSALVMRTRTTDTSGKASAWSSWTGVTDLPSLPLGSSIDVEVKDEEGNVGSSSSALIRGGPDPSLGSGSGCGSCAVGRDPVSRGELAAFFAMALAVVRLRRRK